MDIFKNIYKKAIYLNSVLFVLLAFFFFSLYQYSKTYSNIKTPEKTISIYSHGQLYYVNKDEQQKMNIIGWLSLPLFAIGFGAGLYSQLKYKKTTKN